MSTTNVVVQTSNLPTQAVSLARLFYDRVAATPQAEAFRFPTGEAWTSVTWQQTAATVEPLAAGLLALGIGPEDRVAIVSATRIEWLYADLAVVCAGGATTAVYPSTTAEDVAWIVADSGAQIVVAEDDVQIAKLRDRRDELPDVRQVVTFTGQADGDWVIDLAELRRRGEALLAERPTAVADAVAAVESEHLATLIYTSGTTGRPKGVELPHRCWTYIAAGAEALGILRTDDLQYLWLPLAHSFGKMLGAVQLQVGFATAVDGRVDKIVENLPVVRPTFMAGPPRIFEKVHAAVMQTVRADSGITRRLADWAFGVAAKVWRARVEGTAVGPALRAQHALADRLVLAKVRARLGGRIRFLVSGSAPLSEDISSWFGSAGMVVVEGYGLTETAGGACLGSLEHPAPGTVGPPLAGSELKIAEDGEILLRGPLVMRGYHNQPEATAAVLSPDGWFATGDIGVVDAEGRLRVTDRKKNLIKTSNGKYIAPALIEAMFKAVCPVAGEMLVHGEGRNYATALITLDPDALARWSQAEGLPGGDYRELATNDEVRRYVEACVEELNGRLNRWETIKDFRILHRDMSVETGELTANMKVKRQFIEVQYRELLDSMYEPR